MLQQEEGQGNQHGKTTKIRKEQSKKLKGK